jgi:hypothetical protein
LSPPTVPTVAGATVPSVTSAAVPGASPAASTSSRQPAPSESTPGTSGVGTDGEASTDPDARRDSRRAAVDPRVLRVSTERVGERVVTRLRFSVATAGRMFVVVRGPLPSCRVLGRVPLRARSGENAFDFTGRLRGHPLEPGDYLVTVSTSRQPGPDDVVAAVRVVSERRVVPLRKSVAEAACVSQPLSRFVATVLGSGGPTAGGGGSDRAGGSVFLPPLPPFDDGGLGLGGLPPLDSGAGGDEESYSFVAFAILTILGGFLGALVTLVARSLGGGWNT